MNTTKLKLTNDQMGEKTPWTIAELLGIGYTGDMNPVEHGGIFYDVRDWDDCGYARCVEFWEDPESGALVVQTGVINKWYSEQEREGCFACIGIPEGDAQRDNLHAQIEACRAYSGIEVDGTAFPHLKTFDLTTWRERNIWRSIRGWIEALAE